MCYVVYCCPFISLTCCKRQLNFKELLPSSTVTSCAVPTVQLCTCSFVIICWLLILVFSRFAYNLSDHLSDCITCCWLPKDFLTLFWTPQYLLIKHFQNSILLSMLSSPVNQCNNVCPSLVCTKHTRLGPTLEYIVP